MASNENEIDLECTLCKDMYREPKTLGCLHSFCLECLEIYVERNHSNVCLSCPICRTPFQIQQKQQLSNLPTDSYLLNALNVHNSLANSISHQKKKQKLMCLDEENEATSYCLDCQEYFCDPCTKSHKNMKTSKNHQLISIEEMKNENQIKSISNSTPQLYCQTHNQEEIKFFCEECKLSICSLCVDKHPSHKISTLVSNIVGNEKQLLTSLINQVKPKEKDLREGINKCEEVIKQLEINSIMTQTQIIQLFNQIRAKLDEKEQGLLNKLNETENYKKKELDLQVEELNFGIESIIGSCQMIEKSLSLSTQNDIQLASMKNLFFSRLDYLSNNIWRIEPCHNPFIEFLSFEEEVQSIYSNIDNIGMIDSNEVFAEKCLISREKKDRIPKDEEFKFEIISYSKDWNIMKKGGNRNNFKIQIEGESKSENNENNGNNEDIEWEIKDLNNGRYEVKMKFKYEGKYSIFVQYDGIDIPASSFRIQVFSKLKQRNYHEPKLTFKSNENNCGFHGIATDSTGNIIVCDLVTNRVQIFDFEGNFIFPFGTNGNKNGQFNGPHGIAINSKGNIIVSDFQNHRIQIFDSEGNFISTFGSEGGENGQFRFPYGICVDKNDNIYVCDSNNDRIQIFDFEGNFIFTFGSYGDGHDQFDSPIAIAINSKGNVIVSDHSNHRIKVYDSEGNFISTFGSEGEENGQFDKPCGVCVDLNDDIIICDSNNDRVQIFDSEGEYITQFKVDLPVGITINYDTQDILICGGKEISIF